MANVEEPLRSKMWSCETLENALRAISESRHHELPTDPEELENLVKAHSEQNLGQKTLEKHSSTDYSLGLSTYT